MLKLGRSRGVREEGMDHTIFSLELSQDLVLPNVGQVDFHNFGKYWNFNVLEMAINTFIFLPYFKAIKNQNVKSKI